ncbi:MAG: CDP-alcohol phosphatidyltransferase family protein, partial [Fidelibacterota bacterium]
ARKAHEITNLGRVLDPLADAVVILAVTLFLFMDETRHFPGWILILYVLRYLTIALLAVFVMNHFSVSLGSKWTGKATVTVSALAIFLYIIRIQPLGLYVLLVATALAITSWFQYLVGYSSYFRK